MNKSSYNLSIIAPRDEIRNAEFLRTGFVDSSLPATLCCAANDRFLSRAGANPCISAVVVPKHLAAKVPFEMGFVIAENPLKRFYELHNVLVCERNMGRLSAPAVSSSARIHPSAVIGENVIIGADVVVEAGAIVDNCILEDEVRIGPGALIGVDGHFFKDFGPDRLMVEHGGVVYASKGVQVLAGALLQRAVFDDGSRIGKNTVIGPRVLVAHGVTIGERCILAGGSQVAGFTHVGNEVWIGPGAVVSNLIEIGDRARIEVGAVVVRSVPKGERQSGSFAYEHTRNIRSHAGLWRRS